MRIVIAPDSFKESASAVEVCDAIAAGLRRVWPDADLVTAPMADGGEGTVEALVTATGGRYIETRVTGPLGESVNARYGVFGDGRTAVIEMAAASGLPLVPMGRRNPGVATTFGMGQLIRHAIERDAVGVIVGLGGSATCDGGAGMAQALGYSLKDNCGEELPPGGLALRHLKTIIPPKDPKALKRVRFTGVCDVDNPLTGPTGTARVYARQKGADDAMVEALDAALTHFAQILAEQLGIAVANVRGAGAAGGLGAGMIAFLGAELSSGVEVVAEACGLREKIAGADLVITGEGRIDGQSIHGKTPVGVARIARKLGVPVIALVGSRGKGYEAVYDEGIEAVFPIGAGPMTLEEAISRTRELLTETAEAVGRAWRAARCLNGTTTGLR